jgi:hypothetical protein
MAEAQAQLGGARSDNAMARDKVAKVATVVRVVIVAAVITTSSRRHLATGDDALHAAHIGS